MALSQLNNGDSGATARGKINAVIDAVNAGGVTDPGVYYVRTNGNDGTAQAGALGRPWLTAMGAYTAAVAAEEYFALDFGVGEWLMNLNGANLSNYCRAIRGAGFIPSHAASLSRLNIITNGGDVTNANAANGGDINIWLMVDISISIEAKGGSVFCDDGGYYTAGRGGQITIAGGRGNLRIVCPGGSGAGDEGSTVMGGNGGPLSLTGTLTLQYVDLQAGQSFNTEIAGSGDIYAMGCDFRGCNFPAATPLNAGNCALLSSPLNDWGGNSIWA